MDIIDQLIQFHHGEWWHKNGQTDVQLRYYFETVLKKGRIIAAVDEGKILGYVESFRIDYEQLGKLVCHEPFLVDIENIENGNICYLSNTHILKGYRNSWVYKYLRNEFFKQNYECLYFIGEALRKKHKPIKVFKRQEFIEKYIKEGEQRYG